MRRSLKICAFSLVIAILGAEVEAIVPDVTNSQYEAISERNVFGLRPPPALAGPTNPPVQLPKIILTGITTILGNKRALMKVQPPGMKPNETAKELSLILTEGQREGEIEVLQIDEKIGSVRVNNSGAVMTLTFEKDGVKLPATPVVPPGLPGVPSPLPVTAGAPPNPYALPANGGLRRSSARNPRVSGAAANVNSGFSAPTAAPVGGVPTPTGLAPVSAQVPSASGQDLTPEEQAIILEFQRQANITNPISSQQPSGPASAVEAGQPRAVVPGTIVPFPSNPTALVPQ
jgi:hypothetical protein